MFLIYACFGAFLAMLFASGTLGLFVTEVIWLSLFTALGVGLVRIFTKGK